MLIPETFENFTFSKTELPEVFASKNPAHVSLDEDMIIGSVLSQEIELTLPKQKCYFDQKGFQHLVISSVFGWMLYRGGLYKHVDRGIHKSLILLQNERK